MTILNNDLLYESTRISIVDATRNRRSDQEYIMQEETAILQLSCRPGSCYAGYGYRLTQLGLHRGEEKHFLNIYQASKAHSVSNGS